MKKEDLKKLHSSIEANFKLLEPFRKNRLEVIKEYVGSHFSDHGSEKQLPFNMIRLFVDIFTRRLVANNPSSLVTTKPLRLRPSAATLQLGLNHLIEEIDLQRDLETAVKDALFSVGMVKVGLNHSASVEIGGVLHDVGQPFMNAVELDNFVCDMSVSRWEDMTFIGDRYRVDLEFAQTKMFVGSEDAKKLTATGKAVQDNERHSTKELLEKRTGFDAEEYRPKVELWDLWLPLENKVITIAAGQLTDVVLNEIDWDGPELGPYHQLGMAEVPGSVMPLPPIASHRDLHELVNFTARKIQRQIHRQKEILGVASGGEGDIDRIMNSDDGDVIKLDHPDLVKDFKLGGVDSLNLATMVNFMELFKQMSGNLDSIGGLGPQSDTLGQDKMIADSSSVQVADMAARVTKFTARIVRDLAFYLFEDPLINLPLVKRVPGVEGVEIPVTLTAADREGDFLDYNFDIDPVSMSHKTPGGQLNKLMTVIQQVYAPLRPVFQSQGITLDTSQLIRSLAQYADLPELDGLFISDDGEALLDDQPVGSHERTLDPNTTRTNIRINRPGATNSDRANAFVQGLLGQGNDEQRAVAARATG
ncbi:hypothetical protein LCGC14_1649980 [marine sediment metagenome]|uniref:Uncharacterized protein n=1 Tax=marine sediment metagenome TaxID=412755 RepID=A0A0F9KCW7_9ZZZZ